MGKSDRILPPGPNPREDQMSEKDQRQLRRHLRGGERPGSREEESEDDIDIVFQAEGESTGDSSWKIHHTAGQAEGDRETVDHDLKRREKKED